MNVARRHYCHCQVVDKATPWSGGYIGINSFGFGGCNVHALIKSLSDTKDTTKDVVPSSTMPRLVTCCARTKDGAEKTLSAVADRPQDIEMQALIQSSVGQLPTNSNPYRGVTLVNCGNAQHTVQVSAPGFSLYRSDMLADHLSTCQVDTKLVVNKVKTDAVSAVFSDEQYFVEC